MNGEPLHILHVLPQLGAGGIELALARVLTEPPLCAMRHTVVAVRGENLIVDRLPPQVRVFLLRAKPNELRAAWRLRGLIAHTRPDVIHARNFGSWDVSVLARGLSWRPAPLVYSFHGLSEANPPRRRQWIARLLARGTAAMFTVTSATRDALADDLHLPPARITVIPNGIRTPPQAARPGGRGPVLIGTVGNLTPIKGHELLLRAFAKFRHGAPAIDAYLCLAGDGPLRSQLQALARPLGIAPRCQFVGRIHNVSDFLAELDLFVLPSRSEAHPNALLEAMAAGLPCVATSVGGVPEVLDAGRCGRLVPAGDSDALARAMLDLAVDPDARRRLGVAAWQRARDTYSLSGMAKAYATLYTEMQRANSQ